MTEEFDKEIETLLRQAARSETVSALARSNSVFQIPNSNHLDADEISAFAENALPEKTKQRYTQHLADCGACRKNLSTLVALNAEEPSAIVRGEEKQLIQTPIPWYRKLFVVPNSAYAMGALVLVFSGIVGYTVLQNGGSPQNTEVSQTYEKQTGGKGMSSDGDAASSESFSAANATASNMPPSNAASTNLSSNSEANFSAAPSAPGASTNSNAAVSRGETNNSSPVAGKPASAAKPPVDSAETNDLPVAGRLTLREREVASASEEDAVQQPPPSRTQEDELPAQNQTQTMTDSSSLRRAPMPSLSAESKTKKLEKPKNDRADKSNSSANVGGKTFNRTNNVWYDSAYRGQATTNIARGTDEYKKLDAGLRGIAENLGGAVVIVWKSKAYRIQ